jgi:hypothetical protein
MGKSTLIATLLFLLIFNTATFAQKAPFQIFKLTVDTIYNDLSLNDASLTLSKIALANYPSGVAFAHFYQKTNTRYILVNYGFLFNDIWTNEKYIRTRSDVIRGLLAHEWAHHYLGHTFEKASILNERNADIMAGRILSESGVTDVTAIVQLLENLPKSPHHLATEARLDLLNKGNRTSKVIHSDLKTLCHDVGKDAGRERDKKKLNMRR